MNTRMACETMRLLEESQGAAKSDFKGVEQANDFDLESREETKYRIVRMVETWEETGIKTVNKIRMH